jgi:hypothetical protein
MHVRVKLLSQMAGDHGTFGPGDEVDLPSEVVEQILHNGQGQVVEAHVPPEPSPFIGPPIQGEVDDDASLDGWGVAPDPAKVRKAKK